MVDPIKFKYVGGSKAFNDKLAGQDQELISLEKRSYEIFNPGKSFTCVQSDDSWKVTALKVILGIASLGLAQLGAALFDAVHTPDPGRFQDLTNDINVLKGEKIDAILRDIPRIEFYVDGVKIQESVWKEVQGILKDHKNDKVKQLIAHECYSKADESIGENESLFAAEKIISEAMQAPLREAVENFYSQLGGDDLHKLRTMNYCYQAVTNFVNENFFRAVLEPEAGAKFILQADEEKPIYKYSKKDNSIKIKFQQFLTVSGTTKKRATVPMKVKMDLKTGKVYHTVQLSKLA